MDVESRRLLISSGNLDGHRRFVIRKGFFTDEYGCQVGDLIEITGGGVTLIQRNAMNRSELRRWRRIEAIPTPTRSTESDSLSEDFVIQVRELHGR